MIHRFLLALLVAANTLVAQTTTLRDFYLAMSQPGASLPDSQTVYPRMQQIASLPKAEIVSALPVIVPLLKNPNPQINIWSTYAIGVIGMRPDRDELLRPYLVQISSAFADSSDIRVQTGILVTLNGLPPASAAIATPYLLRALKTAAPEIQIASAALLLRSNAASPPIMDAVAELAQQKFTTPDRCSLINAIGVPGLKHPLLLNAILDGLADPDPNIKFASIAALRKIGPGYPAEFGARLHALISDPSEDPEVKRRAGQLLRGVPETAPAVPVITPPPGAPPGSEKFEPPKDPPPPR